jgi:putative hydrolase of the HAD superfamily
MVKKRIMNVKNLEYNAIRRAETWIFDLDNTLYPASTNLFAQVDVRMRDFIANLLNLPADEARKLQKEYFHESGTTLRGLMTHHGIDPAPYLAYVHDIDVSAVQPSLRLRDALMGLEGKKYIFTNASNAHAKRVMDRLGVADCFEGIFDIVDAEYQPKPDPLIYDLFVQKFKIEPKKAVMVEDIARNLEPAANLGMNCVWIKTDTTWGKEGKGAAYIHYETDDLELWLHDLVKG